MARYKVSGVMKIISIKANEVANVLLVAKNKEKAAKKREKAGLPPQKITQAATQSVRNIQVQENEEPSAEEKEAARKASTEYYNSNQEYRAGSIAAKANMVKQFDEKNSKKKK